MSQEFLDTPNPDQCSVYGPRLTVKFSSGALAGKGEFELHRRLCELCMWGGADRVHHAKTSPDKTPQEEDSTVALSFEFPLIPARLEDDEATSAARMNYHHAVDALIAAGYRCITGNLRGHTEFFRGFDD